MTGGQLYDAMAPEYRNYADRRSTYLAAVDKFIRDSMRAGARRMLDVGSGDGVRAMALAHACGMSDIVLSDVSSEMVKRCRALGATEVWQTAAQDIPETGMRFDVITCLWNVLGHIPTRADRIASLRRMQDLLAPDGQLFFDVQNRHNASAYGWRRVLPRAALDSVWPDERRGDTVFDWHVGEKTIRGSGHLFTSSEIRSLLDAAELRIVSSAAIDYATGRKSGSRFRGQLAFVCTSGKQV